MDSQQIIELLTTYTGRINRAKYWIAVGIYVAIMLVLTLLAFILGIGGGGFLVILIAVIIYIPLLISGIFVGIKRLHDRSKSGWWLALFYGVPGALNLIAGDSLIVSLISLAISIWALVELGCLKGDAGPNAYGPDPLQN